MTATPAENVTANASAPVARTRPQSWTLLMTVIGAIVSYAAMLLAKGNGWSPIAFLLVGIVVTPVLTSVLVAKRSGGQAWLRRIFGVALVAATSFGLAKYSTRIDPADGFSTVLGIAPPSGVSSISARRQWHDGEGLFLAFTADRSALDAILRARAYGESWPLYETDGAEMLSDREKQKRVVYAVVGHFVDPAWLLPRTMATPLRWHCEATGVGSVATRSKSVTVVWDEATGQTIAAAWDRE